MTINNSPLLKEREALNSSDVQIQKPISNSSYPYEAWISLISPTQSIFCFITLQKIRKKKNFKTFSTFPQNLHLNDVCYSEYPTRFLNLLPKFLLADPIFILCWSHVLITDVNQMSSSNLVGYNSWSIQRHFWSTHNFLNFEALKLRKNPSDMNWFPFILGRSSTPGRSLTLTGAVWTGSCFTTGSASGIRSQVRGPPTPSPHPPWSVRLASFPRRALSQVKGPQNILIAKSWLQSVKGQ